MLKISLLKHTLLLVIVVVFCVGLAAQTPSGQEPIDYIGHGAMFDQKGREIPPTLKFIRESQAWYRAYLVGKLTKSQRTQFDKFEQGLTKNLALDGQSRLVLNTYLLDWLLDNSTVENRDEIRGKNNLLKFLLRVKLTDKYDYRVPRSTEPFKINPELLRRLNNTTQLKVREKNHVPSTLTGTSGQAYRDFCLTNGVPIPPDFGPTSAWVSQGLIPQANLFIEAGMGAQVLTFRTVAPFTATNPEGMCIALPRFDTTTDEVMLDGVICVGKVSSKVCFWDNEKNGTVFTFTRGTARPFNDWGGGTELRGATGGVCTRCHAGKNPYIIHPNVPALGNLAGLGFPVFPDNWHDPIVTNADTSVTTPWPENPAQMNAPASCVGCHSPAGTGKPFPHFSPVIPGYCGRILKAAIGSLPPPLAGAPPNPLPTMPQGAPGSLAFTPEMNALENWCGIVATGDASTRGDPHITTFDGINYDFQSAGEFVYLRDAGGLEIQTRHTPVATTFIPGPNPYTGLASCVSVNTAVAARVGTHRVTFQPSSSASQQTFGFPGPTQGGNRLELRIDGKLTTLGDSVINLSGGGRVMKSAVGNGLVILFPDRTSLIVIPEWWESQKTWYMNVDVINTPGREGVMGAITQGNWLPALPNGMPMGPLPASLHQRYIDLNQRFADAWRVTDKSSLFDYYPNLLMGTSTATFTNRNWPPEKGPCTIPGSSIPPAKPMERRQAEKLCSAIVDKNMKAQCVFDVTVTGEASFAKTYLLTQQLKQPRHGNYYIP